jgi:hypothetical protein
MFVCCWFILAWLVLFRLSYRLLVLHCAIILDINIFLSLCFFVCSLGVLFLSCRFEAVIHFVGLNPLLYYDDTLIGTITLLQARIKSRLNFPHVYWCSLLIYSTFLLFGDFARWEYWAYLCWCKIFLGNRKIMVIFLPCLLYMFFWWSSPFEIIAFLLNYVLFSSTRLVRFSCRF